MDNYRIEEKNHPRTLMDVYRSKIGHLMTRKATLSHLRRQAEQTLRDEGSTSERFCQMAAELEGAPTEEEQIKKELGIFRQRFIEEFARLEEWRRTTG